MDREELKRQLMQTFKAELGEHLKTLNHGLLQLEKEPGIDVSGQILAELFRAAHSVKGAARAVELEDIETIAHRMEDVFGALKRGELTATPELTDRLLPAVDALAEAMAAQLQDKRLPANHRRQVMSQLEAALQQEAPPAKRKGSPAADASACQSDGQLPDKKERARSRANSDIKTENKSMIDDQTTRDEEANNTRKSDTSAAAAAKPTKVIERRRIDGETIRVATAKLDTLMAGMGELLVARMRTEQRVEEFKQLQVLLKIWERSVRPNRGALRQLQRQGRTNPDSQPLIDHLDLNERHMKELNARINRLADHYEGDYRHLSLLTDDMQDSVRRVRMVPVASLFELFPRMVRDLARSREKTVELVLAGGDTEIDRQVLEAMKDPLTHLIRNAVDHGIETPDRRKAAGKDDGGTVKLSAVQRGNCIVIDISDDGAGIDHRALRRAAVEKGFITAADSSGLERAETIDLIFQPGLSTLDQVSEVSGRGIGLDVVRQNLERLHGVVAVNTEAGKGTTFSLTLPLTLATSQVLLLEVGGQTVAVPTTTVERVMHLDPQDTGQIEGKPVVRVNGRAIPLVAMAQVLDLPDMHAAGANGDKVPVVILSVAERSMGFRVGGFYNTQEVVIKNLGQQLHHVRNVAGATILGTGQVVMILNVAALMKSSITRSRSTATPQIETSAAVLKRILVVDDSITTRTLERNILENAGYRVVVAADGQEGWDIIQSETLDAAVFDVDMPRMNGLELTERVKSDPRLENLPVVLVTSLETPQDKIKGMQAGADAYITKGSFDQQELLTTIERLVA